MEIKEIFETPTINFPLITIEEIDNSENQRYSDNKGEQFSDLAYQINGYVRNSAKHSATELARTLVYEVNEVLGVKFKMNRLSSPVLQNFISDANIKVISVRYDCVFDLTHNRIYKD